ncbi:MULTISPECIES: hypothetical protein [unclassified Wolbachia]|uniref:hypothetical protein n=1 Tax=unclassified Wolbachia TaxID=2640676 RepID=UPI0021F88C52|nr:hypothetical protein [Wolbachia endosymbiont (group A) of Cheilosia soror]
MPQTQRQCPDYLDPEKLIVNKRLYNIFNKITKKLDPSVKHWDDKKRSTGMTSSLVEIALKSQCSYSYGFIRGIDSANE